MLKLKNKGVILKIEFKALREILKSKQYVIYNEHNKLNIVGIRRIVPGVVNKFDDLITIFFTVPEVTPWKVSDTTEIYKDMSSGKVWIYNQFPATTEPGKSYLIKPINPAGTAILCEGQYVDTYKIDKHNGKYKALCQRLKPVWVWRDNNKDEEYNFMTKQQGFFGINIHRASAWSILPWVDKNSAGCQVVQSPKHFDSLMSWSDLHEAKYGNVFTYTLINEKDFS